MARRVTVALVPSLYRAVPLSALVSLALVLAGCSLARTGFAIGDGMDGSVDRDGGATDDAAREDVGPVPDGGCAPGTVDRDRDPANGCECAIDGTGVELCDGEDDDCDPSTVDGAEDPGLGRACDGDDTDLCTTGGVFVCNAGRLACTDDLASIVELCNGVDDDCDTRVDEPSPEACNGRDDDCDGRVDETAAEICNGVDDDCDGRTDEGPPETCNGVDDDCDGTIDDGPPETCNGVDDDCDMAVDELPISGGIIRYADRDLDGHGDPTMPVRVCSAIPMTAESSDDCDDTLTPVHPGAEEQCNRRDDDCDALIDDGSACGCSAVHSDGHVYQICSGNLEWQEARSYCEARGYHLVRPDSLAESEWLRAHMTGTRWIDARQTRRDGPWVHADGTAVTYTRWRSGEPNDGDLITSEDCVTSGDDGQWNDEDCTADAGFGCEWP